MAASKPDKHAALRKTVQRAQRAWRGLELSVVTLADKKRVYEVLQGLRALDNDGAYIRGRLDDLVVGYWDPQDDNPKLHALLKELLGVIGPPVTPREEKDQKVFDAVALHGEKTCQKQKTKTSRKTR